MPVDYELQYSELIGERIPEWFSTLDVNQRNFILQQTKNHYVAVTAPKDAEYIIYFDEFLAPYAPSE